MTEKQQPLTSKKRQSILVLLASLLLFSASIGCMPLARTVATSGQMLVDRTGKPVPGLPDYEVDQRGSAALDQAIADGFGKMSSEAADENAQRSTAEKQALKQANARQLLTDMLAKTDDDAFVQLLLELNEDGQSPDAKDLPRQSTGRVSADEEIRRRQEAARSRLANAKMSDDNDAGNQGDRQLTYEDLNRQKLSDDSSQQLVGQGMGQSLREIQLPGKQTSAEITSSNQLRQESDRAIQNNDVRQVAYNQPTESIDATGSNRQSMKVEVVSSDDTSSHSNISAADASNPMVSQETLALRQQLKEANELNRQMLAATAAMMPNALTNPGVSGNPMAGAGMNSMGADGLATMLGSGAIGTGLANPAMNSMGADAGMGYGNQALMQMLQAQMAANLQATSQDSLNANSQNASANAAGSEYSLNEYRPIAESGNQTANPNLKSPVEIGQWKSQLTQTISSLQKSLPHLTNDTERQTLEVYLRLLELIASDHDAAVRTIDSMPPEMQDFWRHQIFALSQMTKDSTASDAMFVNHTRQATKTLSHLRDAMGSLQSVAMLQLTNLTFCQAVRSFGDYDLATSTTVSPGDPMLVYCEIENYATRKLTGPAGQRFHARLTPSFAIYNQQHSVVYQEDYPTIEDECKSMRQDFFITLQLQVPANLPPGRYDLVVSVEDLEGNKHTSGSPLPFHIR